MVRKPPRVQFDHRSLEDVAAVAKTINRIQDAVLNTVDELVVRANAPTSPTTPAGQPQSGAIYQGSGAPDARQGNDGDVYFRTDAPGAALQRIYVRSAGVWTGIV